MAFSIQGGVHQVVPLYTSSSLSFISTSKEVKVQHQVMNRRRPKHSKYFTKIKSTTQDEELINNNDNSNRNNSRNRNNNNNNHNINQNSSKSDYQKAIDGKRRIGMKPIIHRYGNNSNQKNKTNKTNKTNNRNDRQTKGGDEVQSRIQNGHCPNHIAFICDGNSRWSSKQQRNPNNMEEDNNQSAQQLQISNHKQSNNNNINNNNRNNNNNYSPTFWGHSRGASNVINLIKHIRKKYPSSINYITMYAFSTENWSRDNNEIKDLWNVIETFSTNFYDWVVKYNNIRVKIIGDLNDDRIPVSLREKLMTLEIDSHESFKSHDNDSGLTLAIAINYGGRKDIINASLKLAELISRGEIILSNNDGNDTGNDNADDDDIESIFTNLLSTSSIPDPDLIIRTGGEQRLSNFLIWNCAYSELYFSDVLWPDFDEEELDKAIDWYGSRERRFGGRK